MREFKTLEIGEGRFRVAPRPRGGDWLSRELQGLKSERVTFVVSLLTRRENEELELEEEATKCAEMGLGFYSYPIVDRAVPMRRQEFEEFASEILQLVERGGYGFLHCRAGLGRAPLLGCTLLTQSGTSVALAWEMLGVLRGHSLPDTDEQRRWVREFLKYEPSGDILGDALRKFGAREG